MTDVKLPELGESVEKVLVTTWLKKVGEQVEKEEPLLEVTTDKVTIEVPSEYTGKLAEVLVKEGEHVTKDTVLCRIEATE